MDAHERDKLRTLMEQRAERYGTGWWACGHAFDHREAMSLMEVREGITIGEVLALLSALDAAESERDALEAALTALVVDHHPPVTDRGDCYYCGLPAGHTSDCPWEQARAALAGERAAAQQAARGTGDGR